MNSPTDLERDAQRSGYWLVESQALLNDYSLFVSGSCCVICQSNAHWYTWFCGQLHDSPASAPLPGGVRPRKCFRCGSVFSLFFNKRLSCGGCGLSICRKCAQWSRVEKAYVCHICAPNSHHTPKPAVATPLLTPSPILSPEPVATPTAFPLLPKSPVNGVDEITTQVRHHLEALVEGSLGAPLDCYSASASSTSFSSSSSSASSVSTSTTATNTAATTTSSVSTSTTSATRTAHPSAVQFFRAHHSALSEAVSHFVEALCMSIYNQPLEPHELPTTRHSELLVAISKVLKEAMILPSSSGSMEGGYYEPSPSPDGAVEDFNSHTYEDILATAILNKVLKTYGPEEAHEVTLEVTHETTTDSTTDTDSGLSGAEKPDLRQSSSRHRVTKTHLVPSYKEVSTPVSSSTTLLKEGEERREEKKKAVEEGIPRSKSTSLQVRASPSPDQGVIADSHQPESWSEYLQENGPPLQFKVEEHIEEVTTQHLAEADSGGESGGESDAGSSRDAVVAPGRVVSVGAVTRHSVSHKTSFPPLSVLPPDPTMVNTRRVSFPELGADILQADSCSDNDCCEMSPGDVIMEADSWEENWLFKKQKVGGQGPRASVPPVAMLIPNPTQDVRASVGNRNRILHARSRLYSIKSI